MDSEENIVATGQNDGSLAVWDLRMSQSTSIIQGAHGDGINELKIHNGEIITASSDTTVKVCDPGWLVLSRLTWFRFLILER